MRRCPHFGPGHQVHFLHLRELGRRPWGWRAGTVAEVLGREVVVVAYLDGGTATLWHHEALDHLPVGYPVRLHEELHALEAGAAVLNVALADGIGAVPAPEDVDAWLREHHPAPVVVADLATGRGVRDVPDAPDAPVSG